jgi:hypothetical protein
MTVKARLTQLEKLVQAKIGRADPVQFLTGDGVHYWQKKPGFDYSEFIDMVSGRTPAGVETFTRAQVDKIPGAFEIHFNYAKFIGQQKSE